MDIHGKKVYVLEQHSDKMRDICYFTTARVVFATQEKVGHRWHTRASHTLFTGAVKKFIEVVKKRDSDGE